jgi:glycosidase
MSIRTIGQLDLATLTNRKFHPSPTAWEDQVLYFLMLDRFSDGREAGYRDNQGAITAGGSTPLFSLADACNVDRATWELAGQGWQGGTLKGLESKLGYLSRMGITAIWISPLFRQAAYEQTYHGYGVQNFLDVDPNFGKAQDLVDLVNTAHSLGIRVILDIILNHSGNVFSYNPDRYWTKTDGGGFLDPRWDGRPYAVAGFHDDTGKPSLPFDRSAAAAAWPKGAVWPEELQATGTFTCKGRINNWDYDPEYLEGDFCNLKDIHHGSGAADDYEASAALKALCECYKYWIALADLDGFRIDTVKHMDIGATRYFASVIHEFTQSIGKERFYLIGEITGGRERAFKTLEETGLDAALGIDDIPDKLEYLVKGYRNPTDYFSLFRNSMLINKDSHVWFRDKVVTLFDDHDQVRKGKWKARFCGKDDGWKVVLSALALNVTSMGIPCIYYGSEQYFNGIAVEEKDGNDLFLRECMFGGNFGSCQSKGRHFFNEASSAYVELAKILAIRARSLPLRRGRQYLREISGNGTDFGLPTLLGNQIRSVVPWSRIFSTSEVLLAINTDATAPNTAWVTIDAGLHPAGARLTCAYSTDPAQIGSRVTVAARNGSAVPLTVPARGFVIYE